jgi:peptidoglycan/LPS O-acetylase OafA/YrhL
VRDFLLLASSAIGGLFFGFLAAVLCFFVVQLIRKGLNEPKQFAFPALALLCIFGTALFHLGIAILSNWPLLAGATVSFLWISKSLFWPEE